MITRFINVNILLLYIATANLPSNIFTMPAKKGHGYASSGHLFNPIVY